MEQEHQEERERDVPWLGLVVVALVVLLVGTQQVLASNAERDEQARKIREAQERMLDQ